MTEKTLPPTQKKLRDARKKGELPKSQEVTATLSYLLVLVTVVSGSVLLYSSLHSLVATLPNLVQEVKRGDLWRHFAENWLFIVALLCAPVLLAASLGGLIGGFAQTKGNLALAPLTPNLNKLNPAQNIKKMFSLKQVFELFKKSLQAIVIGLICWQLLLRAVPDLLLSVSLPPTAIVALGATLLGKLLIWSGIAFIAFAAIDYVLQRVLFMRDQRMSKDEVKREQIEANGNPYIKSKRRALHREMASGAGQARPRVLITNPTHFAVAIAFEPGLIDVPVVCEKAVEQAALLMRTVAARDRIPVFEDVPLARSLYARVEVGDPIPTDLFSAVAEILTLVENMQR